MGRDSHSGDLLFLEINIARGGPHTLGGGHAHRCAKSTSRSNTALSGVSGTTAYVRRATLPRIRDEPDEAWQRAREDERHAQLQSTQRASLEVWERLCGQYLSAGRMPGTSRLAPTGGPWRREHGCALAGWCRRAGGGVFLQDLPYGGCRNLSRQREVSLGKGDAKVASGHAQF